MERFGQIVENKKDRAIVKMRRHMACEGCGRCGGMLSSLETKDPLVEVLNPIGAAKGQTVRVEASGRNMLFASFIIYVVPLIFFFAGLGLGTIYAPVFGYAGNNEIFAMLVGLLMMVLIFVLIRSRDKQIRESNYFRAVITDVVDEEENTET